MQTQQVMEEQPMMAMVDAYGHPQAAQADMSGLSMNGSGAHRSPVLPHSKPPELVHVRMVAQHHADTYSLLSFHALQLHGPPTPGA